MTARNKTIDTRNKPRIWNLLGERVRRDFMFQASAGQIPGVSSFHIFGYDTDLTNTIKLIYPNSSPFVYPSDAQMVLVSSDSVDDTYTGSGAKVVRIVGLDYKGVIQTEDFSLRGVVPVRSIGVYKRILTAFVLSSGDMSGAKGTITLSYQDGTDIGEIQSLFNILTNGNFTVPANSNAYVCSYGFGLGAPKELFTGIRISSPDRENPNWIMLDFRYTYGGSIDVDLPTPYMITENTDIEMIGYTRADSDTYISAYMDLLLIDKEYDWDDILHSEERYNLERVE